MIKHNQVYSPAQISYSNEKFAFKNVLHKNSAHNINNAHKKLPFENVTVRFMETK